MMTIFIVYEGKNVDHLDLLIFDAVVPALTVNNLRKLLRGYGTTTNNFIAT